MSNVNDNVQDDTTTVAAIGLLAYLSADVIHHALGHGGACIASGGTIKLLSSIFVDCSLTGAVIDLAGPFMNLIAGLLALWASRKTTNQNLALLLILTSAFNLFWFESLMAFSVKTKTDDWAWALLEYHISDAVRYLIVVIGAITYWLTIRLIAMQFSRIGVTALRAKRIIVIAWLTAGLLALATGLFDHHPADAVLHHALPQSMLVSIGLLFVPNHIKWKNHAEAHAAPIASLAMRLIALIASIISISLLGPGINLVQ